MQPDDYINDLIEQEKNEASNPYLVTRVMASVGKPQQSSLPVKQVLAFVAGVVLVIVLGMQLGNSYLSSPKSYAGVNINDSQMENFQLFNSPENE